MDWQEISKEFAQHLYDAIMGDLNDPSDAFQLMHNCGFVDEDGDWIYDD